VELEQHPRILTLDHNFRGARKMPSLSINVRMTDQLWRCMQSDLARPHAFAFERVAFLACGLATGAQGQFHVIGREYIPTPDDEYIRDASVGARIGGAAFRRALSYCYRQPVMMMHVHRHDHHGTPDFSSIDKTEYNNFLPSFWNVRGDFPVGALVLSFDSARCELLFPSGVFVSATSIRTIGAHLKSMEPV
jgi:hypothetical protein